MVEFRVRCQEQPDTAHLAAWAAFSLALEHFDLSLIIEQENGQIVSSVPDSDKSHVKPFESQSPVHVSEQLCSSVMLENVTRIKNKCHELLLANIISPSKDLIIPSGILICGPASSGKSSVLRLLRLSANDSTCLFRTTELISTTLIQKEVGASERNLVQLFDQAKQMQRQMPLQPLLLLLDDIDRLFPVDLESVAGMQRYPSVVRRLLDSFLEQSESLMNSGVVLVATAQSEKALHPALIRFGRFEELLQL